MKKIIILSILFFSITNSFAYTKQEKLAADFLSYKDIINSHDDAKDYKLDNNITRREMAKVTINLSGLSVYNICEEKFEDLKKSDWGCKYAEIGLKKGYFAENKKFNPDKDISKIEALKIIMKSRGIEKEKTQDWREGYVSSAFKYGLIEKKFSDYNSKAKRGWIFKIAQNAIEYSGNDEDIKIIEELLK